MWFADFVRKWPSGLPDWEARSCEMHGGASRKLELKAIPTKLSVFYLFVVTFGLLLQEWQGRIPLSQTSGA